MKVLIVDDEPDVVEILSLTFNMQWQGCEVISAGDGEEALELFFKELPDVVILDIGLPNMNGFEVCRRLRQVSDVPILMLTVAGAEMDRVRGLELGADDYIAKPFSPLELVARTRAVLRRSRLTPMAAAPRIVVDDDLTVDLANRRAEVRGQPVKLTPTEFRLLSHLVSNAGRILSHETLLAKAWGREYEGDVLMLKVQIARLRDKLGDDAHNPRYVFTERGVGYRFARPRGTS
jgi:two-component system KDP operon response regulator KdpE